MSSKSCSIHVQDPIGQGGVKNCFFFTTYGPKFSRGVYPPLPPPCAHVWVVHTILHYFFNLPNLCQIVARYIFPYIVRTFFHSYIHTVYPCHTAPWYIDEDRSHQWPTRPAHSPWAVILVWILKIVDRWTNGRTSVNLVISTSPWLWGRPNGSTHARRYDTCRVVTMTQQ